MPALDPAEVVKAFPELKVQVPALDQGSYKVAYRCEWKGEAVVLKLPMESLPDATDDEDTQEIASQLGERFRREIEAMNRVDSPRVVPILAGPEKRKIGDREYLWYLEPFYETTLDRHLAPPWDVPRVLDLLEGLLDGVLALWGNSIVHRDIKPKNIALDADGKPVLLDLGATLFVNLSSVTKTHELAPRSTWYAAPEQLVPRRHAILNFRTDFFPLGVIGFQLLTGAHPYGSLDSNYLKRLSAGTVDRAALERAKVPALVQTLLLKFIQPNPNGRFRTFAMARAAIGRCR